MKKLARRLMIGASIFGLMLLAVAYANGSFYLTGGEESRGTVQSSQQETSALPSSPNETSYSNANGGSSPLSESTQEQLLNLGFQLVEPKEPVDFSRPTPNGTTRSMDRYRGDVIVLNFWATWCPPCKKEMPSMQRLWEEYEGDGLTVLALNMRESPSSVREFVRTYELTFPVWIDDGDIANRMKVSTLPTSWIIGAQGRTLAQLVGPIAWDSDDVQRALENVLAETRPSEDSND